MARSRAATYNAFEAFQSKRLMEDCWQQQLKAASDAGMLQELLEEAHRQLPADDYTALYLDVVREATSCILDENQNQPAKIDLFGIPVHGTATDVQAFYRHPPLDQWLRDSGMVAQESQIRWVGSLPCESALGFSMNALAALRSLAMQSVTRRVEAAAPHIKAWREQYLAGKSSPAKTPNEDVPGMHIVLGWRIASLSDPDAILHRPTLDVQTRWHRFMREKTEYLDQNLFRRLNVHAPCWWEEALQMTTRLHLGCEVTRLNERRTNPESGQRPDDYFRLELSLRRKSVKSDARVLVSAQGTDLRADAWVLPATYADAHGGVTCLARMWQDLCEDNRRLADHLQSESKSGLYPILGLGS